MENDEGNAMTEVLDGTKNLNLIEENEPVQLDAVQRQAEEVINESISSNSATGNGLKSLGNSTEEKVIQKTLIYDTGIYSALVHYLSTLTKQASKQHSMNVL